MSTLVIVFVLLFRYCLVLCFASTWCLREEDIELAFSSPLPLFLFIFYLFIYLFYFYYCCSLPFQNTAQGNIVFGTILIPPHTSIKHSCGCTCTGHGLLPSSGTDIGFPNGVVALVFVTVTGLTVLSASESGCGIPFIIH